MSSVLVFIFAALAGWQTYRLRKSQASEADAWKLVELATETMAKSNEHLKQLQSDPHFGPDGSVHVLWERKDRLN